MSRKAWRLVVTGPAKRDLERIPDKAVAPILDTLQAIAANPYRLGKALSFELEGRFVARRGPYRVIYSIDESATVVAVLAIGHRRDVYRRS